MTRGSTAPGVQAGSGKPFALEQPPVFVRGAGAQAFSAAEGTDEAGAGVAGTAVAPVTTGAAGNVECGGLVAGVQAVDKRIVQRTSTGIVLDRMEVIAIASGRPPSVDRPQGSRALFLTFDGLREAKVRDRDTRIRIALQGRQAARLWRLLGERLTDEEKTLD